MISSVGVNGAHKKAPVSGGLVDYLIKAVQAGQESLQLQIATEVLGPVVLESLGAPK
jgi:hypothetical protein